MDLGYVLSCRELIDSSESGLYKGDTSLHAKTVRHISEIANRINYL